MDVCKKLDLKILTFGRMTMTNYPAKILKSQNLGHFLRLCPHFLAFGPKIIQSPYYLLITPPKNASLFFF